MELPLSLISQSPSEGSMYYFGEDCPVGVKGHIHICALVGDKVLFFNTCTSQTNTIVKHIRFYGADPNSYPCFPADQINKFNREYTYVDCNKFTVLSKEEFVRLLTNEHIRLMDGELTEIDMQKVYDGILCSKVVTENIKKLFRKV